VKTYAIRLRPSRETMFIRAATMIEQSGFLELKNERGDTFHRFERSDVESWWEAPQHSKPDTAPE
jgi:hypothetical protein